MSPSEGNALVEATYRKRSLTHDDATAPKLSAIESVALEALDEGYGECAAQAIQDERDLRADNARLRDLIADTQDRNGYQRSHGRGDVCPWCPYGMVATAGPNKGDVWDEHTDCPAFTSDGVMK